MVERTNHVWIRKWLDWPFNTNHSKEKRRNLHQHVNQQINISLQTICLFYWPVEPFYQTGFADWRPIHLQRRSSWTIFSSKRSWWITIKRECCRSSKAPKNTSYINNPEILFFQKDKIISGVSWMWIMMFYGWTDVLEIHHEAPQGSVLGPKLFT